MRSDTTEINISISEWLAINFYQMVGKAVPEKHLHEKDNLLFPKKLNKAANSVKS